MRDTAPVADNSGSTAPVRETEIETPRRVVDSGPTAGSIEDFKVNVGDRVYFNLDQYRLDADDQDILQRQAAWLQNYPNVRILVAGNADERGTREYNLALGERRASVVRDYLVNLGVSTALVAKLGFFARNQALFQWVTLALLGAAVLFAFRNGRPSMRVIVLLVIGFALVGVAHVLPSYEREILEWLNLM